jgi:hypothetical protein
MKREQDRFVLWKCSVMAAVPSVADVVAESLQIEKNEAVAMTLDKTPTTLMQLKLPQLKAIIKALKDSGYNKSTLTHYANKPELVQMLLNAIRLEGTNPVASPPAAAANNAAASRVGVPSAVKPPMAASASSAHPNIARAPPAAHPGAGSASKAPQPKPHAHAAAAVPAAGAPRAAPAAAAAPKNPYAKYPELNSRRKIEAYQTLRQLEGVSKAEILAELGRLSASAEVDEDAILFSIVAKREVRGMVLTFMFRLFPLFLCEMWGCEPGVAKAGQLSCGGAAIRSPVRCVHVQSLTHAH